MNKERVREISRFVMVGVLATALHYAIYYVLLPYMSHNVAFTVGYLVSFLCNYGLSSKFTFRVGTSLQRFVGFGLSHATNYFIQIILLNLFIGLGVLEFLAPLPVYAVAVPVNYLMVRSALTRRSRENDGYWLFLMVVGFAMLWLNLMDVPTLSDDMIYRFAWQTDETAPVETIDGVGDLLRSQWTHYLSVNGRLLPHLLAQAFLVFVPPVVLQVLNTLLFVLMIHLCATWTCKDIADRLFAAALTTLLLFVVFSGFRTTIVWGLGTFNYLWPTVAVLTLLLALSRTNVKKIRYALLLLAIIAGWTHEAMSLPVSIAFAVWITVHRKRLHNHRLTLTCMFLFMVGMALCMLSPGIWNRAGEGMNVSSRIVNGVVNGVTNVRVTWMLAIALLVMWRQKGIVSLRSHLSTYRYEYIALVVALAIALLCGTTLERVAFYAEFIAMLLLTRILLSAMSKRAKQWLICVCCVIMLLAYFPAYMVRAENADNWQKAEQQMLEHDRELIAVHVPQKGENKLMDYFREHYVNSSFTFGFYCSYMGFDANDINMRCAARLYGKKRLTFLPDDVVERIASDSTAYTDYELDHNKDLYVWRMDDDRQVKSLTFILNEEDISQLMPHQRLLAYKGDEYELDDFNFEVVTICGHPFLVFTKPTTNIYRRIGGLKIEY